MKKRFTEEQIVQILREAETTGMRIRELCRRHNVTEQTFYRWRIKYGGMDDMPCQANVGIGPDSVGVVSQDPFNKNMFRG
jgi:hypothetical protein